MTIDNKSLLRISSAGPFKMLRFSSRMHVLPSLCIYLTSACNYDCFMCESRRSNKDLPRQHMAPELFAKLAGECSRLKFKPRLHFSGLGEPLVYPEFDEVMALCQKHGLPWSITTNGLVLKKHAANLLKYGCRGVNLSVHGVGEAHENIVGTKGAFTVVKDALEHLAGLKSDKKIRKLPVALNCVVNNHNVLKLREIYDEFSTWPINSITFQYISFSQKECMNGADFTITDDQKLNYLKFFVREIKREKTAVPINFFPQLSDESIVPYHKDPEFPAKVHCFLPWLSLRIYPDGAVKMCEMEFGSAVKDTIVDIMNSEAAQQFRSLVRKRQFNGHICFRCCHRSYS